MTTVAPNKITLTCTKTSRTVVWTNRKLIQRAIDKHGSLEAFQAQYVSKGAGKTPKVKPSFIKPILQQGVAMGKMTSEEYAQKYPVVERTYASKSSDVIATVYVAQ